MNDPRPLVELYKASHGYLVLEIAPGGSAIEVEYRIPAQQDVRRILDRLGIHPRDV